LGHPLPGHSLYGRNENPRVLTAERRLFFLVNKRKKEKKGEDEDEEVNMMDESG
jgi:hypothetical protein